jgi:protein-serine/threonine kinase
MFLGKYATKKRLGRGALGDVFLVEDDNGKLYALKLIQVKKLDADNVMRQYLESEIKSMKEMHSPHIIKLYHNSEDKDYIYLLLEYCDGGDLFTYQSKLGKEMVFTLERATEVLAQVVLGLEDLHRTGYLHRDIKPQNVLVKKEKGKEV